MKKGNEIYKCYHLCECDRNEVRLEQNHLDAHQMSAVNRPDIVW